MERIRLRTIHEAIATLEAKRVLAVSQRFDIENLWEDGKKITRPKYRSEESAFLAVLLENGIWNAPIGQAELKAEAKSFRKKDAFDVAIVMGELAYQNISIAAQLRKLRFKKPIFIEITKDSANIQRDIDATVSAAKRTGFPDLLRNLVYLTKGRPSPPFLDLDVELLPQSKSRSVAASRKHKTTPTEFVQSPSDLAEPPARVRARITRVIRDTKIARSLKVHYGFKCQVCDVSIGCLPNSLYIEVHHIKPLGGIHRGTDTHDNMLVLCPNHHAMFDYGLPEFLSPTSIRIHGECFQMKIKHQLSAAAIDYHNSNLRHNV